MIAVTDSLDKIALLSKGLIKEFLSTNTPTVPINMVIINWLKLPTKVSVTALILLPSFMYNTLPTYSPEPLGVFIAREMLNPDKIALNDRKKLMGWMWLINTFHLSASQLQLANMSSMTKIAFQPCSPWMPSFILSRELCKSGWWVMLL